MFTILSTCKGGGYRYCRTDPPHPKANAKGLYPLHRVLAENKIGRLLREREEVHHSDEVKDHDDPNNLKPMAKETHSHLHHPPLPLVTAVCSTCGRNFKIKARVLRLRQKRNISGRIFCCRTCQRPA
jgi:hypothetical protein